jgi:hypothetical protein
MPNVQIARPTGPDLMNTGWTPTPVSQEIGLGVPGAVPIRCSLPPGGIVQVALQTLSRPIAGTYTLTVSCRSAGSGSPLLTIALLQGQLPLPGTRLIAARSVLPNAAYMVYNLVLTQGEVDLISFPANLILQISSSGGGYGSGSGSGSGSSGGGGGGGGVVTECCPGFELPALLYATFSDHTGSGCLDGESFTLQYNSDSPGWYSGPITSLCGVIFAHPVWVFLQCAISGSSINFFLHNGEPGGDCFQPDTGTALTPYSCSPLVLVFTDWLLNPECGGGSCTITVTS